MRLRRKIAAALAAVMALGGAAGFGLDLQARNYHQGTTPQGVQGHMLGHAANHRLGDTFSSLPIGIGNHHGVDFVLTGQQLLGPQALATGVGTLRLDISGAGIWNFGAVGVRNEPARPMHTPLPDAASPHASHRNNMPIDLVTDFTLIPNTVSGAFLPTTAIRPAAGSPAQAGFFQAGVGGGAVVAGWVETVLGTLTTALAHPNFTESVVVSNADRAYLIDPITRVAGGYVEWDGIGFDAAWVDTHGTVLAGNNFAWMHGAAVDAGAPPNPSTAVGRWAFAEFWHEQIREALGLGASQEFIIVPSSNTRAYIVGVSSGSFQRLGVVDGVAFAPAVNTWVPVPALAGATPVVLPAAFANVATPTDWVLAGATALIGGTVEGDAIVQPPAGAGLPTVAEVGTSNADGLLPVLVGTATNGATNFVNWIAVPVTKGVGVGNDQPVSVIYQGDVGGVSTIASHFVGTVVGGAASAAEVTGIPNTQAGWAGLGNPNWTVPGILIPVGDAAGPQDARSLDIIPGQPQRVTNQGDITTIFYTGRTTAAAYFNEIPFQLRLIGQNSIEISWSTTGITTHSDILRVPLAVQATGTGEISVNVVSPPTTANVALIGGANQVLTGAGLGAQLAIHGGVAVGMNIAEVQRIAITETGAGGFNMDGTNLRAFTLTLPHGYVWAQPGTIDVWTTGRADSFADMVVPTAMLTVGGTGTVPAIGETIGGVNRPAEGTPFIFFSSHPDTELHRMHIVLNGASPAAGGVGQINLEQVRIAHRNPAAPIWGEDLQITLSNGFGGGFRVPATGLMTLDGGGNNLISGAISGSPADAFSLLGHGLRMQPVSGSEGYVHTTTSGRVYRNLPTVGAVAGWPTAPGHFDGITRRVLVEEIVPGSALNRSLVFTLTDADGELLPSAKIAAVELQSRVLAGPGEAGMAVSVGDRTVFHNSVPNIGAGQTARIVGADNRSAEQPLVVFSDDGHTVGITGLRPNDPVQRRMAVEIRVFISTDVNFEGNVYLTLEQVGAGIFGVDQDFVVNADNQPQRTLQIAEVEKLFDIVSEVTNIPHRAQSVPVQNVTISERESGAFLRDRNVQIVLSEFGVASTRTEIGFNPITQAQIEATGNLDVRAIPRPLGANYVQMTVTGQSTGANGSELTIEGLNLYVSQAVPVATYGVMARGNAILDNDTLVLNARYATPQGGGNAVNNNPNQVEFRRYGFSGLLFEPYAQVTVPGVGGGAAIDFAATMTAGSSIVWVSGTPHGMTDEAGRATYVTFMGGRNFAPFRGIGEVFAPRQDVSWSWTDGPGSPIRVQLIVGERAIVFTEGSTEYTVTISGVTQTFQTDAAGVPQIINGTTMIPIGFLGHALGVTVSYSGDAPTQNVYFNQPGMGNPMTIGGEAVTPPVIATVEPPTEPPADDNGNE